MTDERQPGINTNTKRPLGQSMSLGGDTEKLAEYYGAWAETYDDDVGATDSQYGLPGSVLVTLDAAVEHHAALGDLDITVLDAGCGTGRVAMALAERGYRSIDGVDLSPEMVAVAQSRRRSDGSDVYRTLEGGVDLTSSPSSRWAASSDLVVVGGVFTVGHIPPSALHQVAELVRPGGVLITTVRPGYYDTTDYRQVSDSLVADGLADLLVEFESLPYTEDSDGRYFAYRING